MFGKIALRLLEATAIQMVAGGTAKVVEKGIVAAADKIKARQPRASKTEPSTKTEQDFEDLK